MGNRGMGRAINPDSRFKINPMTTLRNLIISILDDENGISEESFAFLNQLAETDESLRDVVLMADCFADRFYLHESDAENLRNAKS
jgi:hypothetical protein